MGNNPYQRKYLEEIGIRPVAYNPLFARILRSPTAAILLSQLLYWWDKGRNPEWIYKTVNEIKDETGLTEYHQRTAIKKCRDKRILRAKLAGIPAKRHFQIDEENLDNLVNNYLQEQPQLPKKTKNKNVVKLEPSYGQGQELIHIVPSDITSSDNTSLKNTQKLSLYKSKNANALLDIFDYLSVPNEKPDGTDEDLP